MASRVGLILRTTAARQRSDAAIAHLFASEDLGDLTPAPPTERDVEVAAMLREEWLADVMEALAFGPPVSEEAEGADGTQEGDATDGVRQLWANPEFQDMSREDLEKIASEWYELDPTQFDDDESLRLALVDAYEQETGGSDQDDGPIDEEELLKMKLDDLKGLAIDRGADRDLVSKARSKKDVVALMVNNSDGQGE